MNDITNQAGQYFISRPFKGLVLSYKIYYVKYQTEGKRDG